MVRVNNHLSFVCLVLTYSWQQLQPNYSIHVFVHCIGMEVDDFVETSHKLLQPLEDFFNNVFVMVVRCIWFSLLLNRSTFISAMSIAEFFLLSIMILLMFMHGRTLLVLEWM